MPFGIGGSSSRSSSESFVDPRQQPFLDFTRNLGMSLAQQNVPLANQFAGQYAPQLFQQGLGQMGQLTQNPFLASLAQQSAGNPALVQRQVDQLGSDIGRQFNQQILPGIRRDATAIGALGGSRQGVAEGIAAQGAADALSRGITDIYSNADQLQMQAGAAGGGLLSQGILGGLSAMPGLFDIGLSQFTGGFAPLGLYSQILGAPTVLDKSSSKTKGLKLGF